MRDNEKEVSAHDINPNLLCLKGSRKRLDE
jgi:hypothetical protein